MDCKFYDQTTIWALFMIYAMAINTYCIELQQAVATCTSCANFPDFIYIVRSDNV